MNKALLYCLFSIVSLALKAQPPGTALNLSAQPHVGAAISGSPNSSSLARFREYPDQLFTGLTAISLPIYTIKIHGLEVPIALKYHSAGIRVSDVAGWVGLGWALDAGAMLSRTVVGAPDELPVYGYLHHSIPTASFASSLNSGALATLQSYTAGPTDGEPDIFSYSLGHVSGNFLFQKNSSSPIQVPLENIQIHPYIDSGKMEVVDADGTLYRFGVSSSGDRSLEYAWMPLPGGAVATPVLAWMLKEIISADRSDTIRFHYTPRYYTAATAFIDQVTLDEGYAAPLGADRPPHSTWNLKQYGVQQVVNCGQEQLLREIEFKNGKILLDTGTLTRQDFNDEKALESIRVLLLDTVSGNYVLQKSVHFLYSYFHASTSEGVNKRLKLDSLNIHDAGKEGGRSYVFAYNLEQNLPGYGSRSRDGYGYFNHRQNSTLLPQQTVTRANYVLTPAAALVSDYQDTLGSANRYPDSVFAKANMLTGIVDPAGVQTTFDYEMNQYDSAGVARLGGGLRIRKITQRSHTGSLLFTKLYKYETNKNKLGIQQVVSPDWVFHAQYGEGNNACNPYYRKVQVFGSSTHASLAAPNGPAVFYPVVTEYAVNEKTSEKRVYTYLHTADRIDHVIPFSSKHHRQNNAWKRGQLISQKVYGKNDQLLYQLENTYSIVKDTVYKAAGFQAYQRMKWLCGDPEYADPSAYPYFNYSIETGAVQLQFSQEKHYSPDEPNDK